MNAHWMLRNLMVSIILIFCPIEMSAQDMAKESLSYKQAVALALEHHPSLRAADANVRSAYAGLTQAEAMYLPSLIGTATFAHTDGAFVFNPSFPPRNQTFNNYSAGVQVQQTIFDFGKTIGRVSASSDLVISAEYDNESARANVIMNVELAYFGYVQAQQVVKVNEDALERTRLHLAQAKAFFSVGKRAQIDVTRADVDQANANVNLIRARNQSQLAKLQLENAMGIHPVARYQVTDTLQIQVFETSLDSVKTLTLQRRPELIAARARVEANQSLVAAAWTQHLPTISASGNWNWSNFDFPLFSRWNAGVTFSVPLFQGFSISAQVDQTRANVNAAQANLDALTESMLLEAEQSYLGLKEAGERITASAKLVEQAEETLNLAERQYTAGVGTVIEVTDAQVLRSNARITKIQALFDYNSSLIRLQRSMGMLGKQ